MISLKTTPCRELEEALFRCCGCRHWAESLSAHFPFASLGDLKETGDALWWELPQECWMEAFSHHPRIGDLDSLKKKFAATESFTTREQSGVAGAETAVLAELQKRNQEYEKKFGFVFLVCATGKNAKEMLDILNARLPSSPDSEVKTAAGEQVKITHIRLENLFGGKE